MKTVKGGCLFEYWGLNLYYKCYMKYVYIYVNIYAYMRIHLEI